MPGADESQRPVCLLAEVSAEFLTSSYHPRGVHFRRAWACVTIVIHVAVKCHDCSGRTVFDDGPAGLVQCSSKVTRGPVSG